MKFELKDKFRKVLLTMTILNSILLIISSSLFLLVMNKTSYENEDVNRDGEVNALDLLIVQKKILGEE